MSKDGREQLRRRLRFYTPKGAGDLHTRRMIVSGTNGGRQR